MGKVNLGLLHHEDLTDFIWLSSLGASHPRRFFCCRESESGEEDLHLQLHLRLKWGPSQREEQPGQLRQEVQWCRQGCRAGRRWHELLRRLLRCQEGQGPEGNHHAYWWVRDRDADHRHRAWVRIWIPRDRHANGPWGLWIRHASNWRRIWRVRSWVLESLPRDGRSVPDGQHAGLPRSDDDAHGPVA